MLISNREKFLAREFKRFDPCDPNPFRIAIGGDGRSAYAYGCHTVRREYADTTLYYLEAWECSDHDVLIALAIAYDEAEIIRKEAE